MPQYKLCYFPVRGKGELIRYILHQSGVDFEDNHIEKEEWPKHKPHLPFGQLPGLHIDDGKKHLAQSLTIARYLANEHGLNAESNFDRALCDMYVDGIGDLYTPYRPVMIPIFNGGTKDDAKPEWEKFRDGALKEFLDRYEKFLKDNGTGYLVGSKLTWADLALAEMLNRFQVIWQPDVLKDYPSLAKLTDTVHELPNIKKYVATRKDFKL